uniref:Uncharacterized protein n=1 Tax=Moniliophthora roreri TaxID=221103 RepID=A0A0W0G967_MONRR
MVNSVGKNGTNIRICPPDIVLKPALLSYTEEQLNWKEIQSRLTKEFGYTSGCTLIFQKMKYLNVGNTSQKNAKVIPKEVLRSLVLEEVENDVNKQNSPVAIQDKLAKNHAAVPQDFVQQVMKKEDPDGACQRAPGNRFGRIPCGHHFVIGPYQEIHADGHEKFLSKALCIGPVGFDIHGFWQHVEAIQELVVVPNARHADTIGHLHLDMIVEAVLEEMPVQMTVDKGSETGEMFTQQEALQSLAVLTSRNILPSWHSKALTTLSLKYAGNSSGSMPGWKYRRSLRRGEPTACSTQAILFTGVDLFQWLWPKIVQHVLDSYVQYWNRHQVYRQGESTMPSGATPNQVMICPEDYGLRDIGIYVTPEAIQELHQCLPNCKEVFHWVNDEFECLAQATYDAIGRPSLEGSSAV